MTYDPVIDRLIFSSAVLLSLLAMYTDYRWRIIPNRLTLPAIGLGLILNFAGNGWQGLLFALVGLAVGFGLMLLPYLLGGMGAGDVKLLAALGALLGGYAILNVFLYATILGGILAVLIARRSRRLGKSLVNLIYIVAGVFLYRSLSTTGKTVDKNIKVPYGIALGAGMFCFLLFGVIV
ncbi:MAG: prepilin peptidase [candidate division Zixibacteria bacterium]|nr:prepilin peptidase [candidate division Zixibacteria bacterium]